MFLDKLVQVLQIRFPYAVQKTPTMVIPAPYRVRGKLQPVSSDVAAFYTYQSRWIPEPAPYLIRGQARNDRQRFTLFLLLEMPSKKLYWTGLELEIKYTIPYNRLV